MMFKELYYKLKNRFFAKEDFVHSLMKEYGVKTIGELEKILGKETLVDAKSFFEYETNIDKKEVKEITLIITVEYSVFIHNQIIEQLNVGGFNNLKVKTSEEFIPTADYLKLFKIILKDKRVFGMSVINPYEPYQNRQVLWLKELVK